MRKNLSEDARYGRELGIDNMDHGRRLVRRLGGANKLRALSDEARNILLAQYRCKQNSKIEAK